MWSLKHAPPMVWEETVLVGTTGQPPVLLNFTSSVVHWSRFKAGQAIHRGNQNGVCFFYISVRSYPTLESFGKCQYDT